MKLESMERKRDWVKLKYLHKMRSNQSNCHENEFSFSNLFEYPIKLNDYLLQNFWTNFNIFLLDWYAMMFNVGWMRKFSNGAYII